MFKEGDLVVSLGGWYNFFEKGEIAKLEKVFDENAYHISFFVKGQTIPLRGRKNSDLRHATAIEVARWKLANKEF